MVVMIMMVVAMMMIVIMVMGVMVSAHGFFPKRIDQPPAPGFRA